MPLSEWKTGEGKRANDPHGNGRALERDRQALVFPLAEGAKARGTQGYWPLSLDEEKRLLASAGKKEQWHTASVIIRALLLTGMRSGELSGAVWGQVDFERRALTVGRAKTSCGTSRQIPMNSDLFVLLSAHAAWYEEVWRDAPGILPVPLRLTAQRSHAPHHNAQDRVGQRPGKTPGVMPPA
jgi:integrase